MRKISFLKYTTCNSSTCGQCGGKGWFYADDGLEEGPGIKTECQQCGGTGKE